MKSESVKIKVTHDVGFLNKIEADFFIDYRQLFIESGDEFFECVNTHFSKNSAEKNGQINHV
jgi:hypothetical protein